MTCPTFGGTSANGFCECGCGERTRISPRTRTGRGEVKGQPQRFLQGHAARVQHPPAAERFAARYWVEPAGYPTPCWLWTGLLTPARYGVLDVDGRRVPAHRYAFDLLRGPIPDGHQIDHLCRNRRCVNPDHLEPVTPGDNVRRGVALVTACPQGHPYDEANTYVVPGSGQRQCRECKRAADRRCRARRAGEDVPLRPRGKPRTWNPHGER